MKLLFQDESGDLGFDFSKPKTSHCFVITLLIMDEATKRSGDKIVNDTFRKHANRKSHRDGTLHAFKEKPSVRKYLLRRISEKDVSVYAIVLHKEHVKEQLSNKPDKLYNYMTKTLLKYVCKSNALDTDNNLLIASRRETNRLLNKDFSTYVQSQVNQLTPGCFEVRIAYPYEEKCLQAVDCICWSIYRAREHGDDSYEILVRSRIVKILPFLE